MPSSKWDDQPKASHSSSTMDVNNLEPPEFPFDFLKRSPQLPYVLENLIVSIVTLFAAFVDCILTIYVWVPIGLAASWAENLGVPLVKTLTGAQQPHHRRTRDEGEQGRRTKVVVISGASSGIGASLAKLYARPNHVLVLLARNPARLDQVAESARSAGCKSVETHLIDYSRDSATDDIRNVLRTVCQTHGSLDLVFSNAGASASTDANPRAPEPWGEDTVQRLTKINVVSSYTFIMTAWELMKKQRSGSICVISSIAGIQGPPQFAGYAAGKASLLSFAQSLRSLSTPYGIRVSCICPGFIKTAMTQDLVDAGSTVPQFLMADSNDLALRIKTAVDQDHSTVIWPISHALPGLMGARLNWLNGDLFRWAFSKAGLGGQLVS